MRKMVNFLYKPSMAREQDGHIKLILGKKGLELGN